MTPGQVELKAGNVKETPEASSAATIATPLVRFHHRQEKSITVFQVFVPLDIDVREQVFEANGTNEDVPKISSDADTKDELQMKILSYMSKLVGRLEYIYVFCGYFRTKAAFTLRVF
mgnify:CR=1 FL=1